LLVTGLDATKERREGLIDAAQHVLAGREVRDAYIPGRSDRLQLVGLVKVAKADTVHSPGRAPLVQRGVVQTAGFVELAVQGVAL
jgi:hypothetical protein